MATLSPPTYARSHAQVGLGILGLPVVMRSMGLVIGIILIIGVALLVTWTAYGELDCLMWEARHIGMTCWSCVCRCSKQKRPYNGRGRVIEDLICGY